MLEFCVLGSREVLFTERTGGKGGWRYICVSLFYVLFCFTGRKVS